jgi:hypothetical protein
VCPNSGCYLLYHFNEFLVREKWTLFDEATRIPLIISHPQSKVQGTHHSLPVESIDIFPTIVDLMGLPHPSTTCNTNNRHQPKNVCLELQGKSLASIVLGTSEGHPIPSHSLPGVAISQVWRCATRENLMRVTKNEANPVAEVKERNRDLKSPWFECNVDHTFLPQDVQVSVMGYSFRSTEYRYNIWFLFDKRQNKPILSSDPLMEELYDHRHEVLENYTYMELNNIAKLPEFKSVLDDLREKYWNYLKTKIVFKGPIKFEK